MLAAESMCTPHHTARFLCFLDFYHTSLNLVFSDLYNVGQIEDRPPITHIHSTPAPLPSPTRHHIEFYHEQLVVRSKSCVCCGMSTSHVAEMLQRRTKGQRGTKLIRYPCACFLSLLTRLDRKPCCCCCLLSPLSSKPLPRLGCPLVSRTSPGMSCVSSQLCLSLMEICCCIRCIHGIDY